MADYLKLKGNPKVVKALCANHAANDSVLWSCNVTKINRKGKHQNRALLVTNRHVLNLMPDNFAKCNRCIDIRMIHHISTSSSSQEFAIHVTDEYDYRFKVETARQLEEVVAVLQKSFEAAKGSALDAHDMDVGALSRQVMTKAVVKRMGSNVWNSVRGSSLLSPRGSCTPRGAAAASGKAASGKNDDDDDDDDDGDDSAAEDELADERTTVCANADKAAGSATPIGGAFTGKSRYTFDDFSLIKVLGKGAFGKVMLVTEKKSGKLYAMKSLSKAILAERGEVVHTKTERKTLEDTHHPFLVHLHFAFQTPSKLYLVADWVAKEHPLEAVTGEAVAGGCGGRLQQPNRTECAALGLRGGSH